MQEADIILATGGPGMVQAAYSCGKPALGVGAGNTPAIIDETADIMLAVNSIIHSKTFDNGMICASEQSRDRAGQRLRRGARRSLQRRGCYFLKRDETGQGAPDHSDQRRAEREDRRPERAHHRRAGGRGRAGEHEDPDRRGGTSVELSEEFAHEKLSPVLAMYRAKDFDDALDKAEQLDRGRRLRPYRVLSIWTPATEQEKI